MIKMNAKKEKKRRKEEELVGEYSSRSKRKECVMWMQNLRILVVREKRNGILSYGFTVLLC